MTLRSLSSLFSLLVLAPAIAQTTPVTTSASGNVLVSTATQAPGTLSREEFLLSLTRDLSAHFNVEGEMQLEMARPWSPPTRSAIRWDVNVLDYPSTLSASMLVRCRLLGDAAESNEITVVVRASVWRDVWVARQPIVIGASFDPAVLDTRRVDVLRERDVLPAGTGDRSFVFARGVGAGRPLTWRDIVRRPLVKKGEIVEVSATNGSLLVTMKALAMENGGKGETISVRNPESQKNFAAVIVDEKRVQVRF